ncbi:hypothetical protein ABPG74_014549 [Tetrahymena malaccensis]
MISRNIIKLNQVVLKGARCFSSNQTQNNAQTTQEANFGYKKVDINQKQSMVNQVFHSVADKYDIMNDILSLGIHRCWKEEFVNDLGVLRPTKIQEKDQVIEQPARVLDVAGGTGDIAFRILEKHKSRSALNSKNLKVTVLDINESMLEVGKRRALEKSLSNNDIDFVCGNAEILPFEDNTFDAYTIAYGIRNVPRIEKALSEAHRVLKKGGRLMILEFSKVDQFPVSEIYKQYNMNILPLVGKYVVGDAESYQYLAESIDKFHDQQTLLRLIEEAGFKFASYKNLSFGISAIHTGFKI